MTFSPNPPDLHPAPQTPQERYQEKLAELRALRAEYDLLDASLFADEVLSSDELAKAERKMRMRLGALEAEVIRAFLEA